MSVHLSHGCIIEQEAKLSLGSRPYCQKL